MPVGLRAHHVPQALPIAPVDELHTVALPDFLAAQDARGDREGRRLAAHERLHVVPPSGVGTVANLDAAGIACSIIEDPLALDHRALVVLARPAVRRPGHRRQCEPLGVDEIDGIVGEVEKEIEVRAHHSPHVEKKAAG